MHPVLRNLALFAVAALAAAACAPAAAPGSPSPTAQTQASPTETPKPSPQLSREGTLTIWVDRERVEMIQNVGRQFTTKYNVPINVQELGFGDIRDQLKIAGPAREGPDIIVGAHDWLGELVTNGLLQPIELGAKTSSFDPVALRAFTYDRKLYGLPFLVESIALIYNTELVPQAPTTWEQLKATAKRLQDERKVEQGYVLHHPDPYHSYPIVTGFGGYVFGRDAQGDYNPKDLGLDSAGGIAAMQEIDAMVKSGLLRKGVNYETMMSLFKEKKSAMFISGPWTLNELRQSGVKYRVAPIPTMRQQPTPFVGSHGFMVSAFGKNRLQAQTFLTEFLATDAAMQALYDKVPHASAWLPVRQRTTDSDIAAFAASAATGVPMPAIPQMSAVWEAWGKAIDLIFQQQEAPDKAIKDAATAIRQKIG